MKFQDIAVNREQRYALGTEQDSGKHYVSIPVSNGLVDYEEYYEISNEEFERYRADLASALPLVEQARQRQVDDRLIQKPGSKRGTAI